MSDGSSLEVSEQSLALVGAQAPDPAVLADLEILHDPAGLDLANAGQRFQDGDDLQLGDRVIVFTLGDQLAEAQRAGLELLLQLRPLRRAAAALSSAAWRWAGSSWGGSGMTLGPPDVETVSGPGRGGVRGGKATHPSPDELGQYWQQTCSGNPTNRNISTFSLYYKASRRVAVNSTAAASGSVAAVTARPTTSTSAPAAKAAAGEPTRA